MLKITKGQANTITLTLNERQTLTAPYFLFEFVNDATRQAKRVILTDTSDFPERYNQFVITEVAAGAENLTGGSVNLEPAGFWTYRVYEQTSSTNLLPAQATNTTELELGRAYVIGAGTTFNAPISDDDSYMEPPEA